MGKSPTTSRLGRTLTNTSTVTRRVTRRATQRRLPDGGPFTPRVPSSTDRGARSGPRQRNREHWAQPGHGDPRPSCVKSKEAAGQGAAAGRRLSTRGPARLAGLSPAAQTEALLGDRH